MSEQIKILKPRKALNKAFLKVKPSRTEIECFKSNLIRLIGKIDEIEREENQKNHLRDFLRDTYYKDLYEINTKDSKDLVIHHGKTNKSDVGVIIEAKRPGNKSEMIRTDDINKRAFHELLLYYLRERITGKNHNIKYLIVSNVYEWFIFDEKLFERLFAQNKSLVKQFQVFANSGKTTDVFYREVAEPFIAEMKSDIEFTHFDIRDYEKPLHNNDKTDDNKLIALFKLLSPEHLLNLPFANDSNSLDKRFYGELLHLIGLTETKDGGKKIIERNKEGQRHSGSFIENAIVQLDSLDKISRLETPSQFGANMQERLFNVALELSITWVNRILFLKLLEGQLISYHKGDKSYEFLNTGRIQNYDDLNSLFFQVLARQHNERSDDVREMFAKVPYLNSSLFEPTEMEHMMLFISNLRDEKTMPVYAQTVLKDDKGKRLTGELSTLDYLFRFLSAYDFSSEGSEEIQEENKTLINASVLGLIFEKINGYKDGSFFTPGFITMYMCRETIRKAVIQKFNDAKGWNCTDLDTLYNRIEDRNEANTIINDLKICDPAVGSGHFLVSALNEIIAIKSDLRILQDRDGRRLKEYHFEVVNDEMIVTDEDGELFEYNPQNKESQRIQETLFHEKQTIIENCLFGVDINPNSVKICRLRLWIELLKNAYYIQDSSVQTHCNVSHAIPMELQTLPNIDINIKCGNSLVSRFALDSDLKQALRKSASKWTIDGYRVAVQTYRNAQNKEQKREMERLINDIKSNFRSEITQNDPKVKRHNKLSGELFHFSNQQKLFEMSKKEKADWNKKIEKLTSDTKKLEAEIEEIKSNKIFDNAFEWRFEFPEVLNDEGDFIGFDVVIGNPPYIRQEELKEFKGYYKENYKFHSGTTDIYVYFIEKGFDVLKSKGVFTYIMPNKFMQAGYGQPARIFLLEQNLLEIIDFGDFQVFDEATTYPCILRAGKEVPNDEFTSVKIKTSGFTDNFTNYVVSNSNVIKQSSLTSETWVIEDSASQTLLQRMRAKGEKLETYIGDGAKRGVLTGLTEAFLIDTETKNNIISSDTNSARLIKPFLLGRDVKPYATEDNKNWLILIPKGFTIKRNLPPDNPYYVAEPMPRYGFIEYEEAWEWLMKNYPGVAGHLINYRDKAEARTDKGDYWWELRACDYYDKFEKPKILYQVFQVKPCFIFDSSGMYCNNSMWFIPSDDKVLLGILNSKTGWWLISKYCTAIQNGYQLIWKYFSQIPIAKGDESVRIQVEGLVNEIIEAKKQNPSADTTALETQIDQLVYQLYDLTEEEIAIIEASVK